MLSRLALTLTTAAVLTVAAAPVARADIGFLVMPGFAGAEIDGDGDATKLELVRAGAVIASSDDGAVTVDGLEAGDVARSYNADGTPAGNATYDGTPVISGACVGGTTFTATRAATAEVEYAGAFTGSALEPLTASWDTARPAHVTLERPARRRGHGVRQRRPPRRRPAGHVDADRAGGHVLGQPQSRGDAEPTAARPEAHSGTVPTARSSR